MRRCKVSLPDVNEGYTLSDWCDNFAETLDDKNYDIMNRVKKQRKDRNAFKRNPVRFYREMYGKNCPNVLPTIKEDTRDKLNACTT